MKKVGKKKKLKSPVLMGASSLDGLVTRLHSSAIKHIIINELMLMVMFDMALIQCCQSYLATSLVHFTFGCIGFELEKAFRANLEKRSACEMFQEQKQTKNGGQTRVSNISVLGGETVE
ncbi:hypothetical protein TYRP_005587 [Tyrophagus putrescentiae]|nr:hypothetical protein TYRP_005587 [Tyrophagus putrescentiae]